MRSERQVVQDDIDDQIDDLEEELAEKLAQVPEDWCANPELREEGL